MPVAGGLADHSVGGGHDQPMLERAVLFDLSVEPKKDGNLAINANLTNQQPHVLPTGAPFRNMYLKVTAYDAKGQVVWQNARVTPAKAIPTPTSS